MNCFLAWQIHCNIESWNGMVKSLFTLDSAIKRLQLTHLFAFVHIGLCFIVHEANAVNWYFVSIVIWTPGDESIKRSFSCVANEEMCLIYLIIFKSYNLVWHESLSTKEQYCYGHKHTSERPFDCSDCPKHTLEKRCVHLTSNLEKYYFIFSPIQMQNSHCE